MDAFIHLFPKKEVPVVLEKVKSLLLPNGFGLICTTQNEHPSEGYFKKVDYNNSVKRFRKFWTKQELLDIIEQTGLKVVDLYLDVDPTFPKTWMNAIFQ